jgi:hypothetical protein
VIIKKFDAVRVQTAAIETPQNFTTPPAPHFIVSPAASITKDAFDEKPRKGTCPERKDIYKKLEQIIDLAADAKLVALTEHANEITEQMAGFVNNIEVADYSLPENNPAPQSPMPQQVYPYVPGTSFYFQAVEDTSFPKKYVMTVTDVKAKVAMEKSMQALEQVNWKSLETTLKAQGMKVNVEQIHREIEKALVQIDWKKLNEETNNALNEANDEIQKLQNEFVVKVGNYQRTRTVQQERLKQAQQQILMDRLQQREQIRKMEQEKKKECAKPVARKKKIVQI